MTEDGSPIGVGPEPVRIAGLKFVENRILACPVSGISAFLKNVLWLAWCQQEQHRLIKIRRRPSAEKILNARNILQKRHTIAGPFCFLFAQPTENESLTIFHGDVCFDGRAARFQGRCKLGDRRIGGVEERPLGLYRDFDPSVTQLLGRDDQFHTDALVDRYGIATAPR